MAELPPLSRDELLRYSRHLVLPDVGVDGQRRIKAARVLLVGAGGLGSPAALYLAAAGVGTLGLVDFDVVDISNLQRQVLHGTSDVGRPKLESARARIHDLNPHVNVETHETRLTSDNALDITRRVRHRRRRHRQLRDALSDERRVRAARQAKRLRLDLSIRRAGICVRDARRAMLPLSLPDPAAARASAELRGRRSARRAAWSRRNDPGDRDAEAHSRRRANRSSDVCC